MIKQAWLVQCGIKLGNVERLFAIAFTTKDEHQYWIYRGRRRNRYRNRLYFFYKNKWVYPT